MKMSLVQPQRRRFLAALTSIGASACATALPFGAARAADSKDVWMTDFDLALRQNDWTLGWRTPAGNLAGSANVSGKFPAVVTGSLYRNGPAGHDLGGVRYHHWFDGDGMIQKFDVSASSVSHTGRFVGTDKRLQETAAGKRLVEAFGTKLPDLIPISSPDSLNVANTSVLMLNDELLALWEGGSAVALDPRTLDTRGFKTWRADLKGLPFSAHPRVERDGTVWNFGVGSGQNMLVVYKIGANGILQHAEALPVTDVPMIHDFAITDRHLVFLMPPLVMDRSRIEHNSFLDAHVWRPDLGMRVLVIDKDDFSRRKQFELPAAFLFHVGNAWDDGQGHIRLEYIHSDQPDFMFESARDVMRGQYTPTPASRLASVDLDMNNGRATQDILPLQAEFPRIDPRLVGQRHKNVIHTTAQLSGRPLFSAVAITNVETGASQRYD
jgi:all-trans-8'-apo-beta-carotenal 15,15'-oxygenase